jgi:hypothetical protein
MLGHDRNPAKQNSAWESMPRRYHHLLRQTTPSKSTSPSPLNDPLNDTMLSQRALLRPLQRLSARSARPQVPRRRYATEPEGGFKMQDNAFNRERAAAKAHAAGSAGACCPLPPAGFHWADR